MASKSLSCGKDFTNCADLKAALQQASTNGFDFVCIPIVHPTEQTNGIIKPLLEQQSASARSDLLLNSSEWSTLVVGKTSSWLQLDSEYQSVRNKSQQALFQEIDYAAYLSMPAIFISVRSSKFHNLARCLSQKLTLPHRQLKFWIHIPLLPQSEENDSKMVNGREDEDSDKPEDTWHWWHTFHTMCNLTPKMSVALEITKVLPSNEILQCWLAEPIVCAIISTEAFISNKNGYPVLSKAHQKYLHQLFKLNVQMILLGDSTEHESNVYLQYLNHLWKTQPDPDMITEFARGYEDFLQCPLQPLMENLESQTYEIFEKDPTKYTEYQAAMYLAMLDKVSFEDKDSITLIIMVVGAGRGPLVRAALNAAHYADRKVHIYAVEKNTNAVVTLSYQQKEIWHEKVTVVSCDMREWQAPEKADILVSELLGSFGDNELSPECLDGAQRLLKDDGISIPQDYTSYLAPLQSTKLYNEVKASKEQHKPYESSYETPYVVKLLNYTTLAEPQPVFKFVHPNRDQPIDNTRYKRLQFSIQNRGVLHGFSGYFECTLYKDVKLSILPSTHSHRMCSWFPILFPVFHPVYLNDNSKVTLDFWRLCTSRNVWYEWCLLDPQVLPIHNPNGRTYTIGL